MNNISHLDFSLVVRRIKLLQLIVCLPRKDVSCEKHNVNRIEMVFTTKCKYVRSLISSLVHSLSPHKKIINTSYPIFVYPLKSVDTFHFVLILFLNEKRQIECWHASSAVNSWCISFSVQKKKIKEEKKQTHIHRALSNAEMYNNSSHLFPYTVLCICHLCETVARITPIKLLNERTVFPITSMQFCKTWILSLQ